MATFVGIVREDPVESSSEQSSVSRVRSIRRRSQFRSFSELRDDLAKREGIVDVSIHHVVDRLGVGDESLIIVVLGTRRSSFFPFGRGGGAREERGPNMEKGVHV